MRITETNLEKKIKLAADKSEAYFRDEKLTGYAVRLRRMSDGKVKKTFLVIYQETKLKDGKPARATKKVFIGDYGEVWTEAKAREEAKRLLEKRERGEVVKSAKSEAKDQKTVSELFQRFKADHFSNLKAKTQTDYDAVANRRILPNLGDERVSSLGRGEIRDWHSGFKSTPYEGNRALAILSRMFAHAIEIEWRQDNPVLGIKKFEEKKRDTWITENELPAFLKALGAIENKYAELIKFLLVSGWRISEALGLRFDMIDLQGMVARLPDTKTGESTRALSKDAAALIERQKHRLGYVFSNSNGNQPLGYKQAREALRGICESAGVKVVSPHALRHTAATHAALAGASVFELKEALGWKTMAMPARYVESAEGLSRKGAEKAAGAINIFGKVVTE